MAARNTNLHKAKKAKNDEFYTHYEDIKNEVSQYKEYLNGKIIYLPCDCKKSEFVKFFTDNFEAYELTKVIATGYHEGGHGEETIITKDGVIYKELDGDGDFRSEECIEILKECDIVCTNPPFSLFRDFVDWIMKYEKQFLIIGSQNAFTYKEIFPLIKDNKIWLGYNMVKQFIQSDGTIKKFGNICWFSNLPVEKEEKLILTKTYNPTDYPKYDNYDAIEVNRLANIPKDYYGVMGVPITFIYKYNPNQFEIIGLDSPDGWRGKGPDLNGKTLYRRVLIQRKMGEEG